jgi:hypothetical protein
MNSSELEFGKKYDICFPTSQNETVTLKYEFLPKSLSSAKDATLSISDSGRATVQISDAPKEPTESSTSSSTPSTFCGSMSSAKDPEFLLSFCDGEFTLYDSKATVVGLSKVAIEKPKVSALYDSKALAVGLSKAAIEKPKVSAPLPGKKTTKSLLMQMKKKPPKKTR